jgi:hypothetical protein
MESNADGSQNLFQYRADEITVSVGVNIAVPRLSLLVYCSERLGLNLRNSQVSRVIVFS